MNSSSFKGANSIHTLGRGSLSKINAKFPYASPTKQGGDNSSGITTEITTKEEDSIAQHCSNAAIAISSMSNIKIGDNEDSASKSKIDKGNSNETSINNDEDNSPSKMGFSAKLKMFGSMQQHQYQKKDNTEQFISNDLFDSKRSTTKPLNDFSDDIPQSKKPTADQSSANENDTSPATKTTSPRLSSPVGAKKRMASFLKSRKSIESASSPPSSQYQELGNTSAVVEDGNDSHDVEDNTPSCEEDNTNTKGQEEKDTPKTLGKTVPSFLKSKSSTKQVGASAAAAVKNSSNSTPVNENSVDQSPTNEQQPPIDKIKVQGMKKIASIKQQIKQSSPQRQPKPKQPKHIPSSPTKQSTQPAPNSRNNRPPKKNSIPDTQSHRNKSSKIPTSNMIKAKSRQRLVLEQVASQYFLSERNQQRNNKYVGVIDYGCDGNAKRSGVSSALGNIIDETSKTDADENVDREAVVEFLEGHIQTGDDDEDDDGFVVEGEDAKNLSIITEASLSSCCSRTSASDNRSRTSGDTGSYESQISRETNIDRILEIASDHLSLGKNDLALLAYRRAMKVAFADVMRVKQKLVEVKKRQQEGNLDTATAELTRKEEQQFELSLLEVASRVADVHNNMGVVHEMNRQESPR